MDDGSRCLLDVINDPNLLESFLENGGPEGGNKSGGGTTKAVRATPRKLQVKRQASKKGGQNRTVTSSTSDARQVDLVTSSGCVNSPPSIMPGEGMSKNGSVVMSNCSPMSIQGTNTIQGQSFIRTPINQSTMNWNVRGQPHLLQGGLQTINGQVVLTRPSLQTGINGQPIQQPQPGQLVQIVQTPTGPAVQLIPVPQQSPVIQPPPPPSTPSKVSKGGNKQILPKPSSGASPGPSGRQSAGPQTSNQSPIIQPALTQTISLGQPGNQPQFILGGAQGAPSIISGPNGTLLLNPGFQNYGQNFVLQGNNLVGNMGPLQLTLRTPSPHIVTVSSSNQSSNTNIMNSFNASVSNPMIRGPQSTFVMNNQGPMFAPRGQNIVYNRPPLMSGPPPGTQLLQIQTPNGPMMIALQTNPQMFSSAPGTMTMPSAPQFVQAGGQTTLQTIYDPRTQMISSNSGPMIITSNVQQQPSPPSRKNSSGNKSKGVNLADLLKETGILPDSSPPTSPTDDSNHKSSEDDDRHQDSIQHATMIQANQQAPMFMVPPAPNQANLVMAPNQTPQLRLAVTPDGNVVLQQSLPDPVNSQPQFVSSDQVPTTSKILDSIKDSCGPGSSQPSPDSTTPTLDSTLAGPSTPQSGRPEDACKKKDGTDSDSLLPVSVESLNGGSMIESSETKSVTVVAQKSCLDQPVVSGTPVIDSTGAVQISLNNHEFLERLDSQIKELTNSPSLSPQQKQLLHEFTKLQNTISEAKKQSKFHQQLQKQSQSAIVSTQVTNTQQNPPTQSGVQLVNLLKPPTPTQQIRLISSPSVTSQAGTTYQLGNQLITISAPSNCSVPTIAAAIGPPTTAVQAQTQIAPPTVPVARAPTPKSPTKTSKAADSATDREKLKLKINKL